MDDIEKELEELMDEEARLEAERLAKRKEAEEAADAALRELELCAAKKPEPAKRSLDEVSTELGSAATEETGPSKKIRVEEVLEQRSEEPGEEQLLQQKLELQRLEEESQNLQRLLKQKQEEVLLEKQRQEHEEVARLCREAEERKAREAAEKKAREEAEQKALAKAAEEERVKQEREKARRRAETEALLSASRARVLELKRQLGMEEEKLQATVQEPTPLLRRSSAFDEASLRTQTPVSAPVPGATSVPPAVDQLQASSFQLRTAPSETTPSEAPSDASTKVLGADKKKWEDAT